MGSEFPKFRYHHDPLTSGAFVRTDASCSICGQIRGFKYEGEVFSQDDFEGVICPWCLADGSAADELGAEFTDVGGSEPVSDSRFSQELARRTPAYASWQGPYWAAHCGNYCCFIDYVGGQELRQLGKDVQDTLYEDVRSTFSSMDEAMDALQREGNSVGYLFRCIECGRYRLLWDCE